MLAGLLTLSALFYRASAIAPACTLANILPNSSVPDAQICPYVWATKLNAPRGIAVASNNDLLVVESGFGQVTALWDDNGDGVSDASERAVLAKQSGLNHGVAIYVAKNSSDTGYLYASTQTDVYRWPYTAGTRTALGTAQHVIANLPCCHHVTRTLVVSPDGNQLYVQSGSGSNVDPDPTHAQIRRWNIVDLKPTATLDWSTGELFANGLRNEVGVRFDPNGRVWGVENGCDDVSRDDWGIGDIHNDNPCEEINLFDTTPGKFYGYPYCWSEGILPSPPGMGPMTQWVHPDFQDTPPYSDAWCQNTSNVVPPAHCLPAHNAPLDIIFGGITPDTGDYTMTAYVTSHGSWDRDPPDGYKVFRVMWQGTTITHEDFLDYVGPGATGNGWIRPVSLGFVKCPWGNCLMVSTDQNNEIVGVAYGVK